MHGYQAVRPLISTPSASSGGRCFFWPSPQQPPQATIVALHGFGGCGEDFQLCADTSADKAFDWIAPDLPCHGTSPVGGLEAALQSIHSCQPNEAAILLGYSQGARIALHAALAQPKAWRALVLIGGSPGLENEADRQARIASDETLVRDIEVKGIEAFETEWRRKPLIASQQRMPQPWRNAMEARRANNTVVQLAAALRNLGTGTLPPVWHCLHELQLPVILCVGEEDKRFRMIAMQMARKIAQARIITVPEAGHAPHLENPQTFSSLVYDELLKC